jgi:hypothetical protein
VAEYDRAYGKGALERKLAELAALDRCFRAREVRGPGAVALMVEFTPESAAGSALVASKVILEASSLPVSEEAAFITCADQALLGARRPAVGGGNAISPDTIQVPVSNHALYRWLLEPKRADE